MAQYLDLNPAQATKNDRVTYADISLPGDFVIDHRCEVYNHTSTPAGMLFGGGNSGGGIEVYRNGSLGVQLFINGTSVATAGNVWPYTNTVDINPRSIILRRVGSTITLEFDGVTIITIANSATLKVNSIGSRGAALYLGQRFYSQEITAGAFYRKYDASLPLSVGTVLASNDGLNLGTVVGGASFVEFDAGEPELPTNYNTTISSANSSASDSAFSSGFYAALLSGQSSGGSAGYSAGFSFSISSEQPSASSAAFTSEVSADYSTEIQSLQSSVSAAGFSVGLSSAITSGSSSYSSVSLYTPVPEQAPASYTGTGFRHNKLWSTSIFFRG